MEIRLPGTAYKQGQRQMVVTAMKPEDLVRATQRPDDWNPVGDQAHGNRPASPQHRRGIVRYLEQEENFVMGSVVLYAREGDVRFEPSIENASSTLQHGMLYLDYSIKFDIGDGQHRIAAYADVLSEHPDPQDPVRTRLDRSGQPVVIVVDDNALHRAQDFTDLQRNTKPQTTSLAMSMDRRQEINRLLIGLVQDPALPIFGTDADRVEFFSDSPGKYSAKLFSFKTIRYFSGTVLIGVSQHAIAGWDKAVNAIVRQDEAKSEAKLHELWDAMGLLPDIAKVIEGRRTPAEARSMTYLASSGVLYAIAYAIHMAHHDHRLSVGESVERLAAVSFGRAVRVPIESAPLTPEDTVFSGTLIDPKTGKIGSGRPAWEAAGKDLLKEIVK